MYSSELSLWQIRGSQAKLAKATKEFIGSFTWDNPGEAQSKEEPWNPGPQGARHLALPLTACCLFISASSSTATSFSLRHAFSSQQAAWAPAAQETVGEGGGEHCVTRGKYKSAQGTE